ncbi:MAG TPA: endonuclease/exonuclease/phosphatase family protein, partial [Prolixibacteraceae bacterium]|nr:endonuclease/exonuclease/phosphatase family protein [Prolixibacteraceae bacterium]
NSKRRDAEIIIVANRVSKSKYPVIVAGDFNDVAWSETTNLFRKSSGLLDPRIGRAFLNTYHAQIPFIKWPLDHVFFSPHFTLVNLDKLPAVNSDHYPISIKLSLSAKDTEHFPVKKDSVTQKKETETIEEGIKDAKENN